MQYWISLPGYGTYDTENYYDYQPVKASFGVSMSKHLGDGIWCPLCKQKGLFMWLDFIGKNKQLESYGPCPKHNKIVRIPIAEYSKKKVTRQGL